MKKYSFFVLGIISLLVIAGCESGSSGSPEGSGSAPKSAFLGGSDGLKIDFLKGEPPEEVTDKGTFDFQTVVSLENKGEYDLKRDEVRIDLIGFLASDFGANEDELRDKRPEDDPSPRRRDSEGNVIDSIETFIAFPSDEGFFNYERSVTGNTEFTFRANVCYKYQTKALSQLCVLRDLISPNDAVCDPTGSKTLHSSGSPVKISSFRQTVAGKDKISFSFDVSSSGTGEVYKEGDSTSPPASCPSDPRERREKQDRVLVTIETGLPELRCVGLSGGSSGYINLVEGKRTVTCTQELDPGRTDFETNVEITADFNYLDNEEKRVLVKHIVDS